MDDLALWIVIAFCMWAIVDKGVQTGVLTTVGLGMIVVGYLAVLDDYTYVQRAFTLRTWGAVLACVGMFWRLALKPLWRRHMTEQPLLRAMGEFTGVERRRNSR